MATNTMDLSLGLSSVCKQSRADSDTMCDNCFKIFRATTTKTISHEDSSVDAELQCENCTFVYRKGETGDNKGLLSQYPCKVTSAEGCGRFLVATRDINPGEVILVERPLVIGPTMLDPVSSLYPTCLGCCRVTNTRYVCSKCKWPVCGEPCEKISFHSEFECKIFRKAKIPSLPQPQRYQFIQFLRCCLMKEVAPKKFAELMSLESHVEERKLMSERKGGTDKESKTVEHAFRFINEICKLGHNIELINYIIGVCWVNSFGADALLGYRKRKCSLLFHKLSMLNHNCTPNTRLIIHEKRQSDKDRGHGNIWGELQASVFIGKGETISQQYSSVIQGTIERRSALVDNWYFSCVCARCRDSTEQRTFFSAVKCTKCARGYLLPVNPLDSSSQWKCQVDEFHGAEEGTDCDHVLQASDVRTLVAEFSDVILSCKDNIEKLENLLEENSGIIFHSNHYLMQDIKYQIIEEFINISAPALRNNHKPETINGLKSVSHFEEIAKRCVSYGTSLLEVGNSICPGESTYRGVVIYFLCYSMHCLRKWTKAEDLDKDREIFKNYVDEGRRILSSEPEESPYKSMAERLNSFLINEY